MENRLENLSLGAPGGLPRQNAPLPPSGGGPPPVPQLPPQMFTTAAQLLDLTDTNLVLQDTTERIFAGNLYADVHRGIFIVRGENVLMLGEIDLDKDDYIPEPYQEASIETVHAMQKKEREERKAKDKAKRGKLLTMGFEAEHSGEIIF
ncbi:MAG: SM-like, degradation of cytoplasmic mRNAs and positively regulates transcription initiation [Bathelium mastoideum]|nr:MAG: SM-like, degradation of cytoplasmic mRNAs and positively regulates transcription initiation [Bathelium mastoideum]KAI9690991.1 MAG: SM-like, degradation of cytoplasmic mRNAs and positively regulates transcription initiation [Bathelium mastoideum]